MLSEARVWSIRRRDVVQCAVGCVLACAGAGCGHDVDPCVEDEGYLGDAPVGCLEGHAPVQLWSGAPKTRPEGAATTGARSLVLDETHVYFSTPDERVLRIAKRDGGALELVPLSDCSIRGLAIDETWLYYTRNCPDELYYLRSAIERVPKEGGEPELLAERPTESRDVQVRGGFVLWHDVPLGTQESFLRILDIASGERPGLTDAFTPVASVAGHILPFTVRGNDVFWFDPETLAIAQQPMAGGEGRATSIAGILNSNEVDELMTDGTCIYAQERELVRGGRAAYHIGKLCDDAGEPTAAMAAPAVEAMAVRDGTLYGTGDNDPSSDEYVSRVHRWAPPDFEPVRLAAGLHFARGIAVDEQNLYFLDDTLEELRLYRIER